MVAPVVAAALVGAGASLAGGAMSGRAARSQYERQAAADREFAQHGIRWKVADARAAGIHPLYALGASTSMPSASSVGDTSYGQGLAQAGQEVSRAVEATRTQEERRQAQEAAAARVEEERMHRRAAEIRAEEAHQSAMANDRVQREMWLSQIPGNRSRAQVGPGLPDSVSSVGAVKTVPSEQTSHHPGDPSATAGVEPAFLRVRAPNGEIVLVPNPKLGLDSEIAHTLAAGEIYSKRWFGRYQGLPSGYGEREYGWITPKTYLGRATPWVHPARPRRKGL